MYELENPFIVIRGFVGAYVFGVADIVVARELGVQKLGLLLHLVFLFFIFTFGYYWYKSEYIMMVSIFDRRYTLRSTC